MRSTFVSATQNLLQENSHVALLLGDIGVYAFRDELDKMPNRVFNVGILEQAMIGVGAGMAKAGLRPILHSIAPFVVERALEQIKVDLAYQQLNATLVSVGASFDYSRLGPTHHSPGDVLALMSVPGVEVFLPGSSDELRHGLRHFVANDSVSYIRLSELENAASHLEAIWEPSSLQTKGRTLVISVGPMKDIVTSAVSDLPVSHVYLNTLRPMNVEVLGNLLCDRNVLVVESLYRGSTSLAIQSQLPDLSCSISSIGIPPDFLEGYGGLDAAMVRSGLSPERVRQKILEKI